tara:strand:+ start:142 stop:393 length:252 start_codon:yes stop_codon:yes gene_type:complete
MLAEPKCFKRRCINFIGPKSTKKRSAMKTTVDGVILSCKAFPNGKGIPFEIAYGKNLHLKPFKGDHGIQYEKAKSEEDFSDRE